MEQTLCDKCGNAIKGESVKFKLDLYKVSDESAPIVDADLCGSCKGDVLSAIKKLGFTRLRSA